MAEEREIKLNSSFNNQLKYTYTSEPSVKKIQCILDGLGIRYDSQVDCFIQEDRYYDTRDRAILKDRNSLRIRAITDKQPVITGKHFVSYDTNGQYRREEKNSVVKPGQTDMDVLFAHAAQYFPGMKIEKKAVVGVRNNRTSFKITTQTSKYSFCLDKFCFINMDDGTKSDDFYEIEVEEEIQNTDVVCPPDSGAGRGEKKEDPQLKKLSALFKEVFDYTPTEKNKYAKGVDWLYNPINQKNMQFIIFDIVDYSSRNSPVQKSMIKNFTRIINESLDESGMYECLRISIGDGVILCIDEKSDKALQILQRAFEKLNDHNKQDSGVMFELRTAVHYGHVLVYQDINNASNLAGTGINMVSRMLSGAEKSQVFISDVWFENYQDMNIIPPEQAGCFSEPFTIKVKHDITIRVRNFYDDACGIGINKYPNNSGV